jgi:U3 small nucleolar RNA-associated protein 11
MEKLQDSLHFIDQGEPAPTRRNKHIVFMDSEKDAKKFDVVRHLDTAPELVHRTFNRPRLETLKQTDLDAVVSKEQIKVRTKEDADETQLVH